MDYNETTQHRKNTRRSPLSDYRIKKRKKKKVKNKFRIVAARPHKDSFVWGAYSTRARAEQAMKALQKGIFYPEGFMPYVLTIEEIKNK